MSWVMTAGGYRGDVGRDVMLAAVESRFGNVPIVGLGEYPDG
ncbi:hypothetical protein [Ralstonia solanacearum]|nr:hypothetical protein [Ralstonia solanacearum]